MKKNIIRFSLFFVFLANSVYAQTLNEYEATPSVIPEPEAFLKIMEVNFKNSGKDWAKLLYKSPTGTTVNLKNISFSDDKIFKTVSEDFYAASGQEILLRFDTTEEDLMPYINTDRKGLTATTEQLIVYDSNMDVLDAVCWTSLSPTEKEISDLNVLYETEGWHSNDIFSCLSSEDLATDESIVRTGETDTNSSRDWQYQSQMENESMVNDDLLNENTEIQNIESTGNTPGILTGATNQYTAATGPMVTPEIIEIDQTKINEFQNTAYKTSNTKKESSTADNNKVSNYYSNGDLSENILISEIMPNPEGTDTKNEWIEIFNNGTENINLGNWELDDDEGGSKPYTISDDIIIGSGKAVLFESADTKISLANKEDIVKISDFEGNLIHSVEYEDAQNAKSYSLISIIKEDGTDEGQWIWNEEATPGKPNPQYFEITAEISKEPEFEFSYFFEAKKSDGKILNIEFTEDVVAAPLAKATFVKDSLIKMLLQEKPDEKDSFILKKYEILNTINTGEENVLLLPSIIVGIIIMVATGFFLLQKKFPWQDIKRVK